MTKRQRLILVVGVIVGAAFGNKAAVAVTTVLESLLVAMN